MMRNLMLSGLIIAGFLVNVPMLSAAERPASMLSNTCAGCHGTAGASAGHSIPILAGLPSEYFRRTMQQFKNGTRDSTIMGRIARGYSDAEIEAMATFFEQQQWVSASDKLDPKMIAQGQEIQEQKCARCHLGNGQYAEYRLPRIGGQWLDYLTITLKTAQSPEFKLPLPKLMKQSLKGLSSDELTALAQFFAAQQ